MDRQEETWRLYELVKDALTGVAKDEVIDKLRALYPGYRIYLQGCGVTVYYDGPSRLPMPAALKRLARYVAARQPDGTFVEVKNTSGREGPIAEPAIDDGTVWDMLKTPVV